MHIDNTELAASELRPLANSQFFKMLHKSATLILGYATACCCFTPNPVGNRADDFVTSYFISL